MNMKELENELIKAEYKKDILIQQFMDAVECEKLIVIDSLYNKQCLIIKSLNKRITLLKMWLNE